MCGIIGFLDKVRPGHSASRKHCAYNAQCPSVPRAGLRRRRALFRLKQRAHRSPYKAGRERRLCRAPREASPSESKLWAKFTTHQQLKSTFVLNSTFKATRNNSALLLNLKQPTLRSLAWGNALEIVKQVGSPQNLEQTHGVSRITGTHGIGHTRLSTESRVDLSHSQPFWAHGVPDLAVVHNGHITNYHKLRRLYEQHGIRFYTDNDSEVIGVYLADRLSQGMSLKEALTASLYDLDGSFSFLAATQNELGFAKDRFALKPLLFTETDDSVVVATEEIAIENAFPGIGGVREAQAKEVQVWQLN